MLSRLIQFIKMHFRRADNGLTQILLLNTLCFGGLLFLKTVLAVIGYEKAYLSLLHSLMLPSSWSSYLHQPWSLLTYSWVHTSLWAMLWGLLFLRILGRVIVGLLGSRHFVVLYLLGSLVGGLFFLVICQLSPHFRDVTHNLSGFSSSLYAVITAAATLAPRLPFSLLFLSNIRLRYIVGFLLLFSLIGLSGSTALPSIARLGGAVLGYGYVKLLYNNPRLS